MKDTLWHQPEVENPDVYRALNVANPHLLGFTYSGISKDDWKSIQNGNCPLPLGKGSGDGHDRSGSWLSSEVDLFEWHANWRCGHIHFSLSEELD